MCPLESMFRGCTHATVTVIDSYRESRLCLTQSLPRWQRHQTSRLTLSLSELLDIGFLSDLGDSDGRERTGLFLLVRLP